MPLSMKATALLSAPILSIARLRTSGGGRMDKMKNNHGIPCNEYYHTVKARKDRIEYRFVNTDRNTPSGCTIRLGDTDPITGETVTDVGFFREYHRLADHQIYVNGKETKNRLSLDGLVNDDGDSKLEKEKSFSIPACEPFAEDEPDEIRCLREVSSSLTGRLADVYEALIIKYAGSKEKITFTSLAEKWGVSVTQIGFDRDKIFRMIREAIKCTRKEND